MGKQGAELAQVGILKQLFKAIDLQYLFGAELRVVKY
jgi:hypothetical protein